MLRLMTIPNPTGAAVGGWRHPAAWSDDYVMNLNHLTSIAKTAERGKFDGIFLADGNGVRQMANPELFKALLASDRPAGFEPVTLLSALSQHTQQIGLVATATTTYEEPFHLARKFASLDHLSHGRSGWNIVTTSNPSDSLNFGFDELMPRDQRFPRALEFVDVVKGLWDSWASDAFVQNRQTGQFLEPSRVHTLNHDGPYFKVKGPLNVARPSQGHPVMFTAGQSDTGRELAARHADCLFALALTIEDSVAIMCDVKARLAKYGRTPDSLKIFPAIGILVGRTDEEAEELYQQLGELVHPSVGIDFLSKTLHLKLDGYSVDDQVPDLDDVEIVGINTIRIETAKYIKANRLTIRQAYQRLVPAAGAPFFKGSPTRIADEMEAWYKAGACDGFMINTPVSPKGLEDVVDLVVPELQCRGLFRTEYTGRTFRENLGLLTPRNAFFK